MFTILARIHSERLVPDSSTNELVEFSLFRGRLSGTTTKKIRTDHALLTRENEKLARKLDQVMREQQAHPGSKHVMVTDEPQPMTTTTTTTQEVRSERTIFADREHFFQLNPPTVRRVPKSLSHDTDEEMFVLTKKRNVQGGRSSFDRFRLDLVRHPSYATRYRTVRERYPGDTSPQRRTATSVRRVPEAAIVEGKRTRRVTPIDCVGIVVFLVRR